MCKAKEYGTKFQVKKTMMVLIISVEPKALCSQNAGMSGMT